MACVRYTSLRTKQMNERIKELAEEARADTVKGTLFEIGLAEYSENLAKLIIHECINICNKNTEPNANKTAVDCYYAIRERFGIKD